VRRHHDYGRTGSKHASDDFRQIDEWTAHEERQTGLRNCACGTIVNAGVRDRHLAVVRSRK
jgi:hypothetical protein